MYLGKDGYVCVCMCVCVLFCSSKRRVVAQQQAYEIEPRITYGNSMMWIRQEVSLGGQEKSIITLYSLTKQSFTLDGENNPKIVTNFLLHHTLVNYRNVQQPSWKPEDIHCLIPAFYEWLPRSDSFNSQGLPLSKSAWCVRMLTLSPLLIISTM